MHRTQLYLDDDLWKALRASARKQGTTISALVRESARARYLGDFDERSKAMIAFVGIRKDRANHPDSTRYVRGLRHGSRLKRFGKP